MVADEILSVNTEGGEEWEEERGGAKGLDEPIDLNVEQEKADRDTDQREAVVPNEHVLGVRKLNFSQILQKISLPRTPQRTSK